jgi:hypothetical protein
MHRWKPYRVIIAGALLVACSDDPGGLPALMVDRVEVAPDGLALVVGDTLRLSAYPRTAEGMVLGSVAVTWGSDAENVAVVRPDGVVEAKAEGIARVQARAQGKSGVATVTVYVTPPTPTLAWVMLDPERRSLWVGQLASYGETVRLVGSNGQLLPMRPITWSVSDPDVAEIDETGRVRALGAGVTQVTGAADGASGNAELTVFERSLQGQESYELTYDWWDGSTHLMPHVGDTVWTDAAGTQRSVPFYLYGGSLVLDRAAQPHTYERVSIAEAWVHVGGVLQKIGERRTVDRGTFTNVYYFGTSRQGVLLTSGTSPRVEHELLERNAGELVMTVVNQDARGVEVLFRMKH